MATKKEIEKEINERLSLDFEWRKMPKDDLKEFKDGLDDEEFVKKFVAQLANQKTGDKVEQQIMGWQPGMFLQMAGQLQDGNISVGDLLVGAESSVGLEDV